MTDAPTHPDELRVDTLTVDGVRVIIYHHASFNQGDQRGYRLKRLDTGAETFVMAPKAPGATTPAAHRQRLAEAFVREPQPEDA